jgi:hypothetical protein
MTVVLEIKILKREDNMNCHLGAEIRGLIVISLWTSLFVPKVLIIV